MSEIFDDNEQPDIDHTLTVWYELERALEGKNGFGGDVAEIYSYVLVPVRLRGCTEDERARSAGRVLTRLLRRFVELHDAEVALEERAGFRVIDPNVEDFPPFDHRVHLRVSQIKQRHYAFAVELLALWDRAQEIDLPKPDFTQWDGATKDILLALGMEFDGDRYVIKSP